MYMHDHRRLDIHDEALDVAENAYGLARVLPGCERFELIADQACVDFNRSQYRRGSGRGGDKEFARFLRIATGSACEVEALMDLVVRLYPANETPATSLRIRVRALIGRLQRLERQLISNPAA
jgi:four helix bundle protein